jgi:hypothetical protein
MSHAISTPMSRCGLAATPRQAQARRIPADLRIPVPPRGRVLAAARPESWWREAMRWSIIALTASLVAGEVTLVLLGL